MKKFYSNPLAEVQYLDAQDVIMTSSIRVTYNLEGDDDACGWSKLFPG